MNCYQRRTRVNNRWRDSSPCHSGIMEMAETLPRWQFKKEVGLKFKRERNENPGEGGIGLEGVSNLVHLVNVDAGDNVAWLDAKSLLDSFHSCLHDWKWSK